MVMAQKHKVFRPPPQGAAYAAPNQTLIVQHRLAKGDCAICPDGRYTDKSNCILGPGVIEYTRQPGFCSIRIVEGCTRETYVRSMP